MFDIKNEVNPDAVMIAWRLHTSPNITKAVIFIDHLVHCSTNGKLPELIVVVIIDLESMIMIIW
jgi:hypothetical protein